MNQSNQKSAKHPTTRLAIHCSPEELMGHLVESETQKNWIWFDSSLDDGRSTNQWSFIFAEASRNEFQTRTEALTFLDELTCEFRANLERSPESLQSTSDSSPPFTGGALIALPYEENHAEFPTIITLVEKSFAFHHPSQTWFFTGPSEESLLKLNLKLNEPTAVANDTANPVGEINWRSREAPTLEASHEVYLEKIEACRELTRVGECYELCLTTQFAAQAKLSSKVFSLYRFLRKRSKAPFSFYWRLNPKTALLSASPERFLQIKPTANKELQILSSPIKGTRKRSTDPHVDGELKKDLAVNPKDRSENLMIVDLIRNDLGRICKTESVAVPDFLKVESFSTVHQLISTITGNLHDDVSLSQVITACFPGGSMTGAPKIRSMQHLAKIEGRPRGYYSGIVGYASRSGHCDFAMTIRTLLVGQDEISVGAGGAILFESDPESEWQEVLIKANPIIERVNEFVGGVTN